MKMRERGRKGRGGVREEGKGRMERGEGRRKKIRERGRRTKSEERR